jgi:serine/threonine-protein kinase
LEQLVDNRYRIIKPLGSGGMAEVYLAHDDVLDRDVALKVMSGRHATDDEFVERFRREAQSAAALSHPNIVSVYDRGVAEDGTYYIAMECLPGGTLKDRILKRGALPSRTAAAVALQIAEALRAAHRAGVVHRDIKPHNVLITASGDVKVGDFGIARAASSDTMTKTGLILGTAHYISPEQAMGEPVGPQSDLYSLGVVLYEMLTGALPYDAETSIGIAMKHVNGYLVPPREVNPDVPGGINAVTVKLLSKNPDERYTDADALIQDLERVLDGLEPAAMAETHLMDRIAPAGTAAETRGLPSPPVATKRRRKRWPWLLLLLLVILLGVAAYASYILGWGPARTVEVPNLVGYASIDVAQANAGDFVLREDEQVESRESVGTIVAQRPGYGETVKEGSTIDVDVSGTQIADLPDTVGKTREEAERTLEDAGFKVKEETAESYESYKGYVMKQSPLGGGGETTEVDSLVTITVGTGPATVEVPDLTRNAPEQASAILEQAGLSLGNRIQAPNDTVPTGQITSQDPPAGEEARKGSSVDVTVSSGPSLISVPNVVGQDWITAAKNLQAAGLTVNQSVTMEPSNRPQNEVLSTNPQAGTRVAPGTQVTLTTSQGPPPPQASSSSTTSSSGSGSPSIRSSSNSKTGTSQGKY